MKEKERMLNQIKKLNWTTLLVDFIAAIAFITFLMIFFFSIVIPSSSGDLEVPESTLPMSIEVFGKLYSAGTINFLITIFAIFSIIAVSNLVINFKHVRTREHYDYHRWEAGNNFVQAILSLLTLNFISFGLRLLTTNQLLLYSEDENMFKFIKTLNEERKTKKEQRRIGQSDVLTEEEELLKKRLRRQTVGKVLRVILTYGTLILFALFVLIPFYWMILTALKTFQEARSSDPKVFLSFRDLQWVNIRFVIKELQFGLYIKNTLIVALLSTAGTVITTILAAYAFARIDFKGREAVFSLLMATMMIPGEIYMITNYLTVSKNGFGWIGTGSGSTFGYFATMILPFMTSIFYIFLLRQTFKQVPDSLYKAAKVDGCSDFKYLTRVMIPVAGPTIFTITILSILGSWNAFVWPRLITNVEPSIGKKFWLVSVALRENSFYIDKGGGIQEVMFNLQIAATAIVTVPLIIVFLSLKKYIISGVGRSGTKG